MEIVKMNDVVFVTRGDSEGKRGEVVHIEKKKSTCPLTIQSPQDNALFCIMLENGFVIPNLRRGQIEPFCVSAFPIDSKVYNPSGSFTGKVTGYEYETNRVVCISDKTNPNTNDRTRWAYKVSEIQVKKEMEFIARHSYSFNGGQRTVVAVKDNKSNYIKRTLLIDCSSGEAIYVFEGDSCDINTMAKTIGYPMLCIADLGI